MQSRALAKVHNVTSTVLVSRSLYLLIYLFHAEVMYILLHVHYSWITRH